MQGQCMTENCYWHVTRCKLDRYRSTSIVKTRISLTRCESSLECWKQWKRSKGKNYTLMYNSPCLLTQCHYFSFLSEACVSGSDLSNRSYLYVLFLSMVYTHSRVNVPAIEHCSILETMVRVDADLRFSCWCSFPSLDAKTIHEFTMINARRLVELRSALFECALSFARTSDTWGTSVSSTRSWAVHLLCYSRRASSAFLWSLGKHHSTGTTFPSISTSSFDYN